jgi:hypothetical protein
MIVHVNIKSFQYASVVLIKVLVDPSKYQTTRVDSAKNKTKQKHTKATVAKKVFI